MAARTKNTQGALYEQAAEYAAALETSQQAAVDQMLAAWTDAYWGIRQDMDEFLAKVAAAKQAGTPVSPAWAYQQQRMKATLDAAKTHIAKYAAHASQVTSTQQKAAIAAAVKHAGKLGATAVGEQLPGFDADLASVNPDVLEAMVGFLADGTVLSEHLNATLPAATSGKVREALVHGLATGKSQDWMTRKATEALGVAHSRAVTIMRTESLRAYRHASRATYLANADVLGGWVWNAHLDARTCIACALMDGTEHPLTATLDGHPRCRCAMVPRTKTWDEIVGEPTGIPDTRPPVRSGREWVENQPGHVQRALMGPAKWEAWLDGDITLDDMVARRYDPAWGTMRTERSLVAIMEDRDANWSDAAHAAVPPPVTKAPPTPEPVMVAEYAERYDLDYLNEWLTTPGNSPQALANVSAAINLKVKRLGRQGPTLPTPDQVKVGKAVDKLAAAVLAKGYPSKGYSQTKAIYKAQANGTVGTQVGVVKSLTWEHKVTAQAILAEHDQHLPALARQWQKAQAIEKAHDEALAIHIQAEADQAATDYGKALAGQVDGAGSHEAAVQVLDLAELDLDDAVKAADTPLAAAKAAAKVQAHQAALEAYNDALDAVAGTYGDTDWTAEKLGGASLHVNPDGWGTLTTPAGSVPIPPKNIQAMLGAPKSSWAQTLIPDPAEVQKWIDQVITDADGYVSTNIVEKLKDSLETSDVLTPQAKADLQEALDLAETTGKWKPQGDEVSTYGNLLGDGTLTVEDLKAEVQAPHTDAQDKANLTAAIAEYEAAQVAKANIPVPKPTIDPAKIKWEKASDQQAGKLITQVMSGKTTLDDLYAKFQASKNAGPKANYATAILHLEGNHHLIPPTQVVDTDALEKFIPDTYVSPDMAYIWYENATLGDWDAFSPGSVANADNPMVRAAIQTGLRNAWTEDGIEPPPGIAKAWGLPMKDAPAATPPAAKAPPATPPKAAGPVFPTEPPWKPDDLVDTGQVLGTHGARVFKAPDGTRWLFKPPKDPRDQFLVSLDEAASKMQAMAGLKAPDTFTVTLGGKTGSIQRMFDSSAGFGDGFKPASLSEHDLGAVQREHVLDWLLANHDGHRDQFLRLPNGDLVGIDKGQAFRWFGQDRLDWNFHPNAHYGAPEPVYNALWRDFAAGKDVDLEPPTQGPLADAIADIQAVSDDDLRNLFRPYAEQAAARGLLAKAQKSFTGTDLSIPSNDVEAFLDALVDRKNNLGKDFQTLYDRAAAERAKAIPGWKPKAAKPKPGAKWLDKPKPEAPTPPEAPAAETAALFDDWLGAAKARYAEFSNGKSLEASNNWARFRRVIDDLDAKAVQELADRHYLRPEDVQEALDLIEKAKARRKELEAAYKRAQTAHAKAVDRWKADVAAWKDANGIVALVAGMDDAVKRHNTNNAGVTWAKKHFDEARYTASQRKWLKSYTGSSFSSWNSHLRHTEGKPDQYLDVYKGMDKAMDAQPIPEDVILHRGIGPGHEPFRLAGARLGPHDDLTKIIGSVQTDHGYMSTSVGNEAAFSSYPIQLKIRTPAGTPGAYVQMFSHFTTERELILGRGTSMYVHNAYQQGGKWFVEVEVVPSEFDAATGTPNPSTKPWSQ